MYLNGNLLCVPTCAHGLAGPTPEVFCLAVFTRRAGPPNITPNNTETRAHQHTQTKNKYRSDRARKCKYKTNTEARARTYTYKTKRVRRRARENTNSNTKNTHRNDAVLVGTGRLRENAVPRHWPATYLMLISVRLQNMCRTCLVLCVFFSMKGQTRRGLEQMLTTLRP